jgi:hypothetical protein
MGKGCSRVINYSGPSSPMGKGCSRVINYSGPSSPMGKGCPRVINFSLADVSVEKFITLEPPFPIGLGFWA